MDPALARQMSARRERAEEQSLVTVAPPEAKSLVGIGSRAVVSTPVTGGALPTATKARVAFDAGQLARKEHELSQAREVWRAARVAKEAAAAALAEGKEKNSDKSSINSQSRLYQLQQDANDAKWKADHAATAMAELETSLALLRAEAERTQTSSDLAKAMVESDSIRGEMRTLQSAMDDSMKSLSATQQENRSLRAKIAQLEDAVEGHIASEAALRKKLAEEQKEYASLEEKASMLASEAIAFGARGSNCSRVCASLRILFSCGFVSPSSPASAKALKEADPKRKAKRDGKRSKSKSAGQKACEEESTLLAAAPPELVISAEC